MVKTFFVVSLVGLLSGCTATQCDVAKRSLAAAKAGYDTALHSGNYEQMAKYRWTLDAAQATVDIWCAGVGR